MDNLCSSIGLPEFIGYFICLPFSQLLISLNINALWDKLDFGKNKGKERKTKSQDLFRSK